MNLIRCISQWRLTDCINFWGTFSPQLPAAQKKNIHIQNRDEDLIMFRQPESFTDLIPTYRKQRVQVDKLHMVFERYLQANVWQSLQKNKPNQCQLDPLFLKLKKELRAIIRIVISAIVIVIKVSSATLPSVSLFRSHVQTIYTCNGNPHSSFTTTGLV